MILYLKRIMLYKISVTKNHLLSDFYKVSLGNVTFQKNVYHVNRGTTVVDIFLILNNNFLPDKMAKAKITMKID